MKKSSHPYENLEGAALWKVVRKALRELAKNGDLDLQTTEAHVVGYLAQSVDKASFRQVSDLHEGARAIRVIPVREKAGAA